MIDNTHFPTISGPMGLFLDECSLNSSKEIVLAFGINYGQGKAYCKSPWVSSVPLPLVMIDHTGMTPKIDSLDPRFSSLWPSAKFPKVAAYHLIVANLFPFITTMQWSHLRRNGIGEARVIQNYWEWAITLLDRLLPALSPDYLIFHGANNAVPLFGISYVLKGYLSKSPRAEVIMCDNLAGSKGRIHNCEIL